ncbi:unnamed protein product [Peniophora sp. CBMAI 1063]|nr:unnamed protein product [Peniophora sp. CBMAI 1063]
MDAPVLQINSSFEFDPDDDVRMTTEVKATVREAHTGSTKSEYILNQYKRGSKIGGGQHGTVYICYDMHKNFAIRAMKVVSRKNPRQDRVKELRKKQRLPASGSHMPVTDNFSSTEHKIRKEIAVMKKCKHPNVVRLLEVIDDKLYKKVYMIMEYLGGGEVKWRDDAARPILRVDQVRRIARDVILGLEYLHQQGIIHRDIKPANLLWTEDRRMVKIADFGVAHISAAHAARSEEHTRTRSSADDLNLLFDDSELCKTAGTPSFLAPEVIYEYGTDPVSTVPSQASLAEPSATKRDSKSTLHAVPTRPPITKAVDVWAFGVSLYGMLFGHVPYHPPQGNEYALYRMICTEDWEVPATMGYDKLPTGGRPPDLSGPEPTQGALVINLLERVLEKDASKRATLVEVKRHPWFMRDISNSDAWVKETVSPPEPSTPTTSDDAEHELTNHDRESPEELDDPYNDDDDLPPGVTPDEYETAVTQVKFRWTPREIGKRIKNLLGGKGARGPVLPPRHARDQVGIHSEPSAAMGRFARPRSAGVGGASRSAGASQVTPPRRKKEAQPARHQIDRPSRGGVSSVGTGGGQYGTVGSVSTMATRDDPLDSNMRSLSPTRALGERERTRSKYSIRQLFARSPSGQTLASDVPTPSTSTSTGVGSSRLHAVTSISLVSSPGMSTKPAISTGAVTPASATGSSPSDGFGFGTPPQARAASWGNVGDYAKRRGSLPHSAGHDADGQSIYSGAGDEPDDDTMFYGAGGVADAPHTPLAVSMPPTPGVGGPGFVPFAAPQDMGRIVPVTLASSGIAHAMAVPPELLHGVTGRDPSTMADPANQAPSRSGNASRTHARSPLVQAYASSDDGEDWEEQDRPPRLPEHFDSDFERDEEREIGGQGEAGPSASPGSSQDSFEDDDSSFFERTSASDKRRRELAKEAQRMFDEEGSGHGPGDVHGLGHDAQDSDEEDEPEHDEHDSWHGLGQEHDPYGHDHGHDPYEHDGPRPTASQLFGEECSSSESGGSSGSDDEDESMEAAAIEVRRRRPSASVGVGSGVGSPRPRVLTPPTPDSDSDDSGSEE